MGFAFDADQPSIRSERVIAPDRLDRRLSPDLVRATGAPVIGDASDELGERCFGLVLRATDRLRHAASGAVHGRQLRVDPPHAGAKLTQSPSPATAVRRVQGLSHGVEQYAVFVDRLTFRFNARHDKPRSAAIVRLTRAFLERTTGFEPATLTLAR